MSAKSIGPVVEFWYDVLNRTLEGTIIAAGGIRIEPRLWRDPEAEPLASLWRLMVLRKVAYEAWQSDSFRELMKRYDNLDNASIVREVAEFVASSSLENYCAVFAEGHPAIARAAARRDAEHEERMAVAGENAAAFIEAVQDDEARATLRERWSRGLDAQAAIVAHIYNAIRRDEDPVAALTTFGARLSRGETMIDILRP